MVGVHQFNSTGEAYDASQTSDIIKDGDVLVVGREQIVGVLLEAWPCAVTDSHGEFHTLAEDTDITAVPQTTGDIKDYSESWRTAERIIKEAGFGS